VADLAVTPEYLDTLAAMQDQAADKAGSAATAASDLSGKLWLSHGIASGASNLAFSNAEEARQAAGNAIKKASTELAVKLRAASDAYQATDDQTGENIDKQVRPS
jgi:Excreted virulence factor EspC, type VII ESX diderm